jgi:hypothetical protein
MEWKHTGLVQGSTHYYKCKGYNTAGESTNYSAVVSATVGLATFIGKASQTQYTGAPSQSGLTGRSQQVH